MGCPDLLSILHTNGKWSLPSNTFSAEWRRDFEHVLCLCTAESGDLSEGIHNPASLRAADRCWRVTDRRTARAHRATRGLPRVLVNTCSECTHASLAVYSLHPPLLHRGTPDRSPALPGHVIGCWLSSWHDHTDKRRRAGVVVNPPTLRWMCGGDRPEDDRRD